MTASSPHIYIHRVAAWHALYLPPENVALLESFATVTSDAARDEPVPANELVRKLAGVDGILSLNGLGAPEITTEVLQAAGSVRVAAVSHWWHGPHDKAAAMWRAAGLEVLDASHATTDAVAEWTLAAILMGVRRLPHYDRALKNGSLWAEPRRKAGLLSESTIGLIGLGRIGRRVAELLRAFGATVIGYDAYVAAEDAAQSGVQWKPFREVLSTADVVSFHLPVTDETKGLFGAEELSWIRDGAVIVNSARAALFDNAALLAELRSGRCTAFLDVFESEPLPLEHPLRSLENVFLTPHISGDTASMFVANGRNAILALQEYFQRTSA